MPPTSSLIIAFERRSRWDVIGVWTMTGLKVKLSEWCREDFTLVRKSIVRKSVKNEDKGLQGAFAGKPGHVASP